MHYLGININNSKLECVVLNEDYSILCARCRVCPVTRSWETILDESVILIQETVKSCNLTIKDFEWLGVGIPGVVNKKLGIVEISVNLNFFEIPVKSYLQDKLRIPVIIDNDASAAAFGEYILRNRNVNDPDDLILLIITLGIGVGVIHEGKIFRGSNGLSSEMGHISIEQNGEKCFCGRRGCLDTYASTQALIQATKKSMKSHRKSKMWKIAGNLENVDLETAFNALELGDKEAKKVIETYCQYLASGITSLLNIFQPKKIIIVSDFQEKIPILIPFLENYIKKESLRGVNSQLPYISGSIVPENLVLIGSALLGLEKQK